MFRCFAVYVSQLVAQPHETATVATTLTHQATKSTNNHQALNSIQLDSSQLNHLPVPFCQTKWVTHSKCCLLLLHLQLLLLSSEAQRSIAEVATATSTWQLLLLHVLYSYSHSLYSYVAHSQLAWPTDRPFLRLSVDAKWTLTAAVFNIWAWP